jgi:hypothetical protein
MKVTLNGVDRSASYKSDELEQISVRLVADQGEVGTGAMPQPDTAGTQEYYAGQSVLLEVGADQVFYGYVGALNRERNEGIGNRLVNTLTLSDQNAGLDGYATARWSRPAETDYARIMAFNTDFLGALSLDTTWVLNTHTANLPAKTYQSESLFSELQDDCGKPTGKTMFVENGRLHWHLYTEGIIAGIAIVEAEDADHAAGAFELLSQTAPVRSKDPIDLTVTAIAVNSSGATATDTDTTAQTHHDSAGLRHQKLVDAGDTATAGLAALAAVAVAEGKTERITYAGTIGPLTAAQLADIPPGSLMNVTDHVWGLSSATQRNAAYTLRYKHPNQFYLDLELGFPIRVRAKPPATTPPIGLGLDGGILPPFVCELADFTVPTCSGGDGHALPIGPITGLEGGAFPSESSESVRLYTGAVYRVTFTANHATTNFECLLDYDVQAGLMGGSFGCNGPAPMPAGITFLTNVVGYITGNDGTHGPGVAYCAPGTIYQGAGYAGCNCVGATGTVEFTYISGPDPRYVGLGRCANGEPMPGQPVEGEGGLGDGVTTSFMTGFPYKPGSLHIEDNGRDWTPRVTETDPSTGAYDIAYPYPLGSTVVISYKAS